MAWLTTRQAAKYAKVRFEVMEKFVRSGIIHRRHMPLERVGVMTRPVGLIDTREIDALLLAYQDGTEPVQCEAADALQGETASIYAELLGTEAVNA